MAKSDTIDREQVEERQVNALAKLPEHLAVIKMQDEAVMAMASARPRNHKVILADIKEQLVTYPTFARAAMYRKPVGEEEGGSGRQKYAEGLSIRAAEAVRTAFGYTKVSRLVDPIDEMTARLTATCVDYQTGNVSSTSIVLSRIYKKAKKWGGGTAVTPEDRFYNVVCGAKMSILVRNAILDIVPSGLKLELVEAVKDTVATLLTPEVIERILGQFGRIDVTVEMLEDHLAKKRKDWDQRDRVTLLGIWNALDEKEVSVQEVFANVQEAPAAAAPAAAVRDAVEKASKTKAAPAVEKPPAEEPAPPAKEEPPPAQEEEKEPTYLEKLEMMLADACECTQAQASKRINDYCMKVLEKPAAKLAERTLKSAIESRIKNGDLKVPRPD